MGAYGTGRLYIRGEIWWLELAGQRMSTGVRGGVPGKPPKAAELFRAAKLTEYGRGEPLRPDTITYDDLEAAILTRYRARQASSLPNLTCRLKSLRREFGGVRANHMTEERILAYAVKRRDVDGYAIATINVELSYLRRAFNLLRSRYPFPPRISSLPGERIRQGFLEPAPLDAILRRMRADMVPALQFLGLTGWRVSEALGLEWRRIDVSVSEIRLYTSKNEDPRTLAYKRYAPLRALLEAQRVAVDELQQRLGCVVPWVFPDPLGHRIKLSRIEDCWDRARKRAGLPAALMHDLRRAMARRMELARIPRSIAMTIMGQRSEAIYRRYAIVAIRDQEEALERLALASGLDPAVLLFPQKNAK